MLSPDKIFLEKTAIFLNTPSSFRKNDKAKTIIKIEINTRILPNQEL